MNEGSSLSLRWRIAWLMFLAGLIIYWDRSTFSISAPLAGRDLNFGLSEMG
jgi:hypothetical protein